MALFVVATLPLCVLQSEVSNLGFRNFSSQDFSPEEIEVLGLSLKFTPTPTTTPADDLSALRRGHERYIRSIYLTDFFETSGTPPDTCPARFRVPNPGFNPRNVDGYTPSADIAEYEEATFSKLTELVAARDPHIPNLSWAHRKALSRLRGDRSLVIGVCDKNLGLFAADATDYEQHCRAALSATHAATAHSQRHAVILTLTALRSGMERYLPGLPEWAQKWISGSGAS
jgi:hypothetical protein